MPERSRQPGLPHREVIFTSPEAAEWEIKKAMVEAQELGYTLKSDERGGFRLFDSEGRDEGIIFALVEETPQWSVPDFMIQPADRVDQKGVFDRHTLKAISLKTLLAARKTFRGKR